MRGVAMGDSEAHRSWPFNAAERIGDGHQYRAFADAAIDRDVIDDRAGRSIAKDDADGGAGVGALNAAGAFHNPIMRRGGRGRRWRDSRGIAVRTASADRHWAIDCAAGICHRNSSEAHGRATVDGWMHHHHAIRTGSRVKEKHLHARPIVRPSDLTGTRRHPHVGRGNVRSGWVGDRGECVRRARARR
jgi:hypothetical protein